MEEDVDEEDEDEDENEDDEKKIKHTSRDLLRLCVRWVEDVCVRDVGSRERVVIGGRTCRRRRCTRV